MHARVQPERYQRQLRLFHEIVGFRKLGLVYEDSPSGRSYAAVDAVRQIAMEKGFFRARLRRARQRRQRARGHRQRPALLPGTGRTRGRRVRHREPGIDTGRRRAAGPDPARGEDSELLDAGLRGSARRPVDELGAGGLLLRGALSCGDHGPHLQRRQAAPADPGMGGPGQDRAESGNGPSHRLRAHGGHAAGGGRGHETR